LSKRKSYFIRSEGPDRSAVERALGWIVTQPEDQIYFAVLGYGNVDPPSIISEVMGKASIKALKKGNLKIN